MPLLHSHPKAYSLRKLEVFAPYRQNKRHMDNFFQNKIWGENAFWFRLFTLFFLPVRNIHWLPYHLYVYHKVALNLQDSIYLLLCTSSGVWGFFFFPYCCILFFHLCCFRFWIFPLHLCQKHNCTLSGQSSYLSILSSAVVITDTPLVCQ